MVMFEYSLFHYRSLIPNCNICLLLLSTVPAQIHTQAQGHDCAQAAQNGLLVEEEANPKVTPQAHQPLCLQSGRRFQQKLAPTSCQQTSKGLLMTFNLSAKQPRRRKQPVEGYGMAAVVEEAEVDQGHEQGLHFLLGELL